MRAAISRPYRADTLIRVLPEVRGYGRILSAPTTAAAEPPTGRLIVDPYRSVCICRHRRQKKPRRLARLFCLCWHYLSSRQVTLQVLSAQMSLTSVFGMGTGGPSSQSIPTMSDGCYPSLLCQNPLGSNCFVLHFSLLGDPYRIRTDVKGVRGLCLNHLTNGPLVHLHGLEPGTH